MLNKAVTLYLLVFLFVRRRDDIVAGEDGVSEKEDMETDGVRQGASCYLWVEQQRLIEYCQFYRGTVTRATPALGSGRIRGQEEWGGWRGMKGLESGEWKTIRTKQISTEVTATLAACPRFFLLSDIHQPPGRVFLRAFYLDSWKLPLDCISEDIPNRSDFSPLVARKFPCTANKQYNCLMCRSNSSKNFRIYFLAKQDGAKSITRFQA